MKIAMIKPSYVLIQALLLSCTSMVAYEETMDVSDDSLNVEEMRLEKAIDAMQLDKQPSKTISLLRE